jgi:YD repeat-containing protein
MGERRMTVVSTIRIGLAASAVALAGLSIGSTGAAAQASSCPGQVSVGPSAALVPAPGGMPANCTVAFSDGTVNYAGEVTGYAYDGYTKVTTIYDQQGQIVGVTNSLGETTYLTPAPSSPPVATLTDSLSHVTSFSYDPAGSVAQVVDPMGGTTRYQYDSSEHAISTTDPLGHTSTYTYDSGHMATSLDPAGVTTTYTYDGGQITGASDTTGHTTTYNYTVNQLTSVTDNSGGSTTYTYYDPGGQLETETVKPPPGGVTTTYMYDLGGHLTSISESGGPTTTFTYDGNLLVQETETVGGMDEITKYSYDPDGNLISVTDLNGKETTFSYDAVGSLIGFVDPVQGATGIVGVPEPSTWRAMLLGFAGLVFVGRMQAKKGASLSA